MKRIILCKHCNKPEYYGNMISLNGSQYCRDCYKHEWEKSTHKKYVWNDLDGKKPTMDDYLLQEQKSK